MKNRMTRRSESDHGKLDIVISFGLLVGSTILLLVGSTVFVSAPKESNSSIPLHIGENHFTLYENGLEAIGALTIQVSQKEHVELSGSGDLLLREALIRMTINAKFNLLGQLQSGSIDFAKGDTVLSLVIHGIHPVELETAILRPSGNQIAESTYPEHIECNYSSDSPMIDVHRPVEQLQCMKNKSIRKLQELLNRYDISISPTSQKDAVLLHPSSVTFRKLQRELLSVHLTGDAE
ncbi:MAG: hypothetical protein KDD70_00710 [Bdellovibrionales bacterium]|nr:hypothetical protein [Bdellovibrionales bacterium]